MIKKIFLYLNLFLFITNCGFQPLYSINERDNINFEILKYEGDRDINFDLISKLRSNSNPEGKVYKIIIITNYGKKTIANNLAGEPEEYQVESTANFTIIENNSENKFSISEKFVMKNFSDDFEERNYETNIKKSMANLIYKKFLLQIKKIK